jgi:Flp pilus assembly protein TadD
LTYNAIGQNEKSLDFASQAMRIDPKDAYAYDDLASAYMALNRFDEAKSIAEQAEKQQVGGPGVRGALTDLAYIRGDWATYDRLIGLSHGAPNEGFVLFFKASGQDALGKVQAGRQTWQQARSLLLSAGVKDFAAALFDIEASDNALLGYPADARHKAPQALELSHHPDVRGYAAFALASAGDEAKSAAILADLGREFPDNYFLNAVLFPMVRAQQYLQKNRPTEAITVLEPIRRYELGGGPHGTGFWPNHLRGMAYLKLQDGGKAAAEFQRILDHQGVAATDPIWPLAHLNLGRALALQGDKAKARTAYQDFFATWKDADPDVPILRDAKAEYAKLQ